MQTTAQFQSRVRWRMLLVWMLATGIGWVVAVYTVDIGTLLALAPVPFNAREMLGVSIVASGVGGAMAGSMLGIAQWLVLRMRLRYAHRLILASALAMAIAWPVSKFLEQINNLPLLGILLGTLLGFFQCLLIPCWRWVALIWIPVNALAWGVGTSIFCNCGVMQIISQTIRYEIGASIMLYALGLAVPGIIAGTITGLVLVWLSRRTTQ